MSRGIGRTQQQILDHLAVCEDGATVLQLAEVIEVAPVQARRAVYSLRERGLVVTALTRTASPQRRIDGQKARLLRAYVSLPPCIDPDPGVGMPENGWTDEEAARSVGLTEGSWWTRCSELRDLGLIEWFDYPSGAPAERVSSKNQWRRLSRITDKGREWCTDNPRGSSRPRPGVSLHVWIREHRPDLEGLH